MSYSNGLPSLGDRYKEHFNKDIEAIEIRRKSKTEGNASITETMELISELMKAHQLTFIPHKANSKLVLFPFIFKQPAEGDIIVNSNTSEEYTIEQVIVNPKDKKWNGLIKLDLKDPPSIENRDLLYFKKEQNYIDFDHVFPSSLPNQVGANSPELMRNPPPMNPTITWNVIRREPGGLSKAFDPRKEFKPRLRESYKDPIVPGYTVQIYGRNLDNIVEFECWSNDHKTSDKLVNWFENFLNTYSGILRQCGVSQIMFWQRPEESFNKVWRQSFAVRATQFYVRTEELEASYERDLVKVDITLGVGNLTNRIFSEKRYIAEQLVTGELTYDEYKNLFYKSGEYQFGEIHIEQ